MRKKKVLDFPFRSACLARVFVYGDSSPYYESKPARAGLQTEHGIWPSGLHAAKRISYICCVGLDWRWREEQAPPVRICFAASACLHRMLISEDSRPIAIEAFSLWGVPSSIPVQHHLETCGQEPFMVRRPWKNGDWRGSSFCSVGPNKKDTFSRLIHSPLRIWNLRRTLPQGRAL